MNLLKNTLQVLLANIAYSGVYGNKASPRTRTPPQTSAAHRELTDFECVLLVKATRETYNIKCSSGDVIYSFATVPAEVQSLFDAGELHSNEDLLSASSAVISAEGELVIPAGAFISIEHTPEEELMRRRRILSCASGDKIDIHITTDDYGYETTWELKDINTDVTISNSSKAYGAAYESNNTFEHVFCAELSCYNFTIHDSYGDGICCKYGVGSYEVFLNNETVKSGANFSASESTVFGDLCESASPSDSPSHSSIPSVSPSSIPSVSPSVSPSKQPSIQPSASYSFSPSQNPSFQPSLILSLSSIPSSGGLREIFMQHHDSKFEGNVGEDGFIYLTTIYNTSDFIEDDYELKLSEGKDCDVSNLTFVSAYENTAFTTNNYEGYQFVRSVKKINVKEVENEVNNTAYFCEGLKKKSDSGKIINEVNVKYELTADPTNGEFSFDSLTLNDSQDVSQSLEIYPDANVTVERCDGDESALGQGQLLCLDFTLSNKNLEDGLIIADIDELSLTLVGAIGFKFEAIVNRDVTDNELVSKKCSDDACEVNILMFKEIFERFTEDQVTATLEGKGRAVISREGKNYDTAEGNEFMVSVELVNSGCGEEQSLLNEMGDLFSLIANNLNL